MASNGVQADALLCLRQAIATNTHPILTTSPAIASVDNTTTDLAHATHLQFHHPEDKQDIFPLTTPTRFESSEKAVDLRSILFAWQRKDDAITDYIAATRKLNEELPGGAGGAVQNLVFAERLDLVSWLDGTAEDSEHIKPLAEDVAKAHAQADGATSLAAAAATTTGGSTTVGTRASRAADGRVQQIYSGERILGDRNSVLHGIKATVRTSAV
jgi:parafibromin